MPKINIDLEDKRVIPSIVAIVLAVVFAVIFPAYAVVAALGWSVGVYTGPKLTPLLKKLKISGMKDAEIDALKKEVEELTQEIRNLKESKTKP
jgi:citrate lyase alpha subunit